MLVWWLFLQRAACRAGRDCHIIAGLCPCPCSCPCLCPVRHIRHCPWHMVGWGDAIRAFLLLLPIGWWTAQALVQTLWHDIFHRRGALGMFSATMSTFFIACKPGYKSCWPHCSLELLHWEPLRGELRALSPVADTELTLLDRPDKGRSVLVAIQSSGRDLFPALPMHSLDAMLASAGPLTDQRLTCASRPSANDFLWLPDDPHCCTVWQGGCLSSGILQLCVGLCLQAACEQLICTQP